MGILGWIVLGLIMGVIAQMILGDAPGGIIVTIILGIVGAVLGGFLGNLLFDRPLEEFFSIQTWALAFVGSLIVIGAARAIGGRTKA